jgi:hypothetical protein
MNGNDKKTATNARERLWPFVTYDQYIRPVRSVKDFFPRPMRPKSDVTSASHNPVGGVAFFSADQVMGKNRRVGYTQGCI